MYCIPNTSYNGLLAEMTFTLIILYLYFIRFRCSACCIVRLTCPSSCLLLSVHHQLISYLIYRTIQTNTNRCSDLRLRSCAAKCAHLTIKNFAFLPFSSLALSLSLCSSLPFHSRRLFDSFFGFFFFFFYIKNSLVKITKLRSYTHVHTT